MARKRVPHEVDVANIIDNVKDVGVPEIASFAKTFNELLVEKGIHQDELAHATGISTGSISSYRNGKKEPRLSMIVKIADYLGVDCHYLLTGVSTKNLDVHAAIGLMDDEISAIQKIPPNLQAAFREVIKSQPFQELLSAISNSARYADNRGDPTVKHMLDLLKGKKNPHPSYDLDIVFRYQTSEAAGKLFDDVSKRLYDKMKEE